MASGSSAVAQDSPSPPSMNAYMSFVSLLLDANAREESKLKVLQELSADLENIVNHASYPEFLAHTVKTFLKLLQDGKPHFISEHTTQAIRKLLLEIIHRIPTNDHLKNHVKPILSMMFKLLEFENEENVLVCLRIIIELHKTFKPAFSSEIKNFLTFVKNIYRKLPSYLDKIFEPRLPLKIKDTAIGNVEALLNETFTTICFQVENSEKTPVQYNLLPRAVLSLKVLAELPIIVVLIYQLYKQNIHQEVSEFIPLIMGTITLKPSDEHRNCENFNREVFVDFMAAQIKTLSFLAYIVRIYQDVVKEYSDQLVAGMLGLLRLCPQEVAHLRKELLIAARHILATDLRDKFVNSLEELFDENILIGSGWTAYESLRPLAYSTLADLVHHVRLKLPLKDLAKAVTVFSRNVHDESLLTTIQTMSCKLLLNLVECIQNAPDRDGNGREILVRMLEVFVLKFKTITKLQLPVLMLKCRQQQQQQQQLQNAALAQSHAVAASQGLQANLSSSQGPQVSSAAAAASHAPQLAIAPILHPVASTSQANVSQGAAADIKPKPKEETRTVTFPVVATLDGREEKPKFGFPASQALNYSVTDCRSLVKTLVCGAKTITWGISTYKAPNDQAPVPNKQFQPRETLVFIRLIKYAFQALDVYTLPVPGQAHPRNQSVQAVRPKEEKEVLEYLAGVYTMMNPLTFREVFSTTIDYMVDRIFKNYALQIVANSFLANPTTSPIFATILVEYLLKRMEEMGSNAERSNLYLKLFKLVFGSVSLFPTENEQMLKPHLHQIVNRSMELALSAEDPYNYFLLLRALFRSIGGGSHDLLYQEFLPLLPNLLLGLNLLQSGLHKQHMKDLFVELCLTVPVRLSSLLPYLPMLMDPLVSALNGSPTLVSQGLRTLELCVDNLQPDFLYEHIQPVKAELMQALWRTLRSPNDSIAQVAFRVLGKFGGGNRKMMMEPQKLEYKTSENAGPCITVEFPEHKNSISLPIEKVIETAFNTLKSSTTDAFYRKQCWLVIEGFLAANIEQDSSPHGMQQLFAHSGFSFGELKTIQPPLYKCPDAQARKVHEMALTGMYVAAAIKELRPDVLPFMANIVRHYTAVLVAQQSGVLISSGRHAKLQGVDPLVLIDATAAIMGHEEKELCKPGSVGLILIIDTSTALLSTKSRASQMPFFEYVAEKMCSLCYERAWYAKLGGCIAIECLMEKLPPKWVYAHMFTFMKALLFVMMDLTGEVSSGAVDNAKNNLEKMMSKYGTPIVPTCDNRDLIEAQEKAINEVVQELIRHLTLANTCARKQAMHSLQILAKVSNKTITTVIEPHRDLLVDMIPPRKHFLRHQPISAQIGMLDGNTFCITLPPLLNGRRLFVIDLEQADHQTFYTELLSVCELEDAVLQKQPCYKSVTDFVPLKKAALRVLAALHYLKDKQHDIFTILYRALNSSHTELQETGFDCLKQLIGSWKLEDEAKEMELKELKDIQLREQRDIELKKEKDGRLMMVHTSIRPLLLKFKDYHNLNIAVLQQLSYLTQLFPNSFNENLCEQLLQHLQKWLEVVTTIQNNERELKICSAIINIFHQIPAATAKLIEPLLTLVLKTEKELFIEAGSPFREPVVKFLQLYPLQTIELLLKEQRIQDEQASRFLEYLLKNDKGKPFREVMQKSPLKDRLVTMALGRLSPEFEATISAGLIAPFTVIAAVQKAQYLAIRVISLLIKYDDQWLSSQRELVGCLRTIWISKEFQERHLRIEGVDFTQWKEPKLLAKCLLNFVKHNPHEIELLFQLLRAFTGRFIPDFEFLRDFLENTVAKKYDVTWKRIAFFTFVKLFHDQTFPQDLKAKILQYVLIPSFAVSFEKGEELFLIGGDSTKSPSPEEDRMEDVMSVFINKVIDPEKPFGTTDAVRILLLQFSCLLVEQASRHIHNAENKKQGSKLRRLMTFAWPCLLVKNCVDPATKYHGHLLLANIIAKFAIHKRIVLQVFHSLLKAHAAEARTVVRQALEILTPAMPVRMEDGNNMLTHWTKKIIVEEGHTLAQLVHLLQLLVRHYKVYYPVRHHLIHHMVSSVQRLVFTPNATLEHKKLAVDLAEVIIRWELQRHKEEQDKANSSSSDKNEANMEIAKRMMEHQFTWGSADLHCQGADADQGSSMMAGRRLTDMHDIKKKAISGVPCKPDPDRYKPVDKVHADNIINFLLRMACQVNETSTAAGSSGELLSRRCVALLKTGLKADVWPNAKLSLTYFDKLLQTVEAKGQQPNFGNICTALDLLAFLLTILRKETILPTFRSLQTGISACLKCNNTKVIRSVHNLLSRLMNSFPTEPTNSNVASKFEELEGLYATVHNTIFEGLQAYEKSTTSSPSALFGTLMILKAACVNNPCYIDRLIAFFMRALQKMAREHLNPTTPDTNPMHTDLLILSLDLVKNRVGVMGQDMRKTFIGTILVGLIEKSPSVNVLKAITKMVEDWVKCKTPIALNQSPSIREKSILQVKMMQFIEKRFPNELELNAQFLELVHYVYNDASLKGTELQSKLEPAFMAGLRCVQPAIRAKFFEVFNASIRPRLHERLMYVVCSQNWETMGPHFWIKQCIELLLVTAVDNLTIQSPTTDFLLPSLTSVLNLANSKDRTNYQMPDAIRIEIKEEKEDEEVDIEMSSDDGRTKAESLFLQGSQLSSQQRLSVIIAKQGNFLESLKKIKTIDFLTATAQLCHMDTTLAQHLWIELFPRLWKILIEKHQNVLAAEITPFLCSGIHVIQKDCHPSAAGTFAEGVAHCVPPISLKPLLLKYLGKSYNVWHRSCLLLEQLSFDKGLTQAGKSRIAPVDQVESDLGVSPQHEALDMIAELYSQLKEEDLWSAIWQKRAKFSETILGVGLEQHGFFELAQEAYENAMQKYRRETVMAAPVAMQSECILIPDHWVRCSRELNDWEAVLEYGNAKECSNPYLVLENAWRKQDWEQMKKALEMVEQNCPKEVAWKVNLYKGYLSICNPEDRHLNVVDRLVEVSSNLCIREWRRLPHIVSHVHLPMLQAAQQIMELQDAVQIHQGLLPSNVGRQPSLHDMKATMKTWRNRLPVLSDDLSHWSEIFAWRHEHYQTIVSSYDPSNATSADSGQANHAMLGYHASAQSLIHFAKIARKHGLVNVSLEALGKIHTIPSVPLLDCFQKIRQELKCFLQMAYSTSKSDPQETQLALKHGLQVIDSTNMQYFSKEMVAEFFAIKGIYLAQLGQQEEANKAFSAATQLHDVLVKAWASWGEYLEQIFTKDKSESRPMKIGAEAVTCYLHSCRHQNEAKSRKYVASVIWLLTFDDEQMQLSDTVDKFAVGVPPIQWVPWVPQLLTCLMRNEGLKLLNLLTQVGRAFPQAVYFPIRTLYLISKIEQRERSKSELGAAVSDARVNQPSHLSSTTGGHSSTSGSVIPPLSETSAAGGSTAGSAQLTDSGNIRATPAMWRCSRIMHVQHELYPTVLASLEGIVDQMVWFRENVYEEVLRQLRQGLAKCYAVAYENAGAISDASVTPHTLNFVKKLVSTFGVGVENVSSLQREQTFATTASESLARRVQATKQDPVFQKMKGQFTADFDFNAPGAMKLHNLINKLTKWIKILEAKTKLLPKSFLIEQKCRFLSFFTQQTADIELPGEFLLPRHNHFFVRIARFMPRVDIIHKHNTAARRLYIKGHNGKIYPFLVINDACLSDARREERVLQLLRMLNSYLGKQKETSRRFLNFTVPRVVSLSPQIRLVEDNVSSVCLLDIYKQCCEKRNVEHDAPLHKFYERLATVQARGSQASHQVLRDILKDVQNIIVPRDSLKKWAERTYPSATDYWTFRKQFILQLSLIGFVEYVLHLTRLNPDMMYIHQDSGLINVSYFRFNVDDVTGELDANRPVPFRLTPNIVEFVTPVGICGPMTASMIAVARCLVQSHFKIPSLLKAILRDETIAWHKKRQEDSQPNFAPKDMEGVLIIQMVTKAVSAITSRLQSLVDVGPDSKVSTLITAANSHDNLCRMDPAWHPWL